MTINRVAAAVLVCALAAGCSKKAAKPSGDGSGLPPPMSKEEQTRNTDACKAYAEQVCACATAHPDSTELVDRCKYDRQLPDALDLIMATALNAQAGRNDIIMAQSHARTIATQCLESLAKLPGLGCQ